MIQILKKRWAYHSLIWISSYLLLTLLTYFSESNTDSFVESLKDPLQIVIPIMVVTYIGFWAKDKFFDTRKYLPYVLILILAIVIGVMSNYPLEKVTW